MSLKASILRNVGASTATKLLGSICTIALVPILLALLGVEKYGVWLVISAVPTWLSIADVGFGAVAANEMSIRVAREDWNGAEAVFQSAWAAILALSALAAGGVLLAVHFGDWPAWLSVTQISAGELSSCLLVLGFASVVALQGNMAVGLFRAAGRADVAILIGGSKPLVDLGLLVVALLISPTLLSVSLGLLTSQLALVGGGTLFGLRMCPKIRPGFSRCNFEDIWFCLRKGLAFCLFPLGNALTLQGSTLVVNHVLGATAVVTFNTCRTMMRSAQQLMNMVGQSAWPEFSHLVGSGDMVRSRRLHHLTLFANMTLALAVCGLMIAAGPLIYGVWTGRMVAADRSLIAAFSVGILGNAVWFASSTIVGAANRHERLALVYLIGAVLTVPACYLGAVHSGLSAAALASVCADICIAPVVVWMANQITGETLAEFLRGLLRAPHDTWNLFHRGFGAVRKSLMSR